MKQRSLRDMAPELTAELRTLLLQANEGRLAAQVDELVIVDRCRCGEDFCSTFYTMPRPNGPYGATHRTVALAPRTGMLHVDVVGGKIVCVEVLYRRDLKAKIHAAVP
jgi:hypothetical protein